MENNKQKMRRSDFVFNYGPGAIIEGVTGSRLIPSLEGLGTNCKDSFFKKHELKDVRMSSMLNNKSDADNHLIEIPSNNSVSDDEDPVIYSTVVFPAWHVCYKREPAILYFHKINEEHCPAYDKNLCFDCDKENNPNVRFVKACPSGHLDDLNWSGAIHYGMRNCGHKSYFLWEETGNSLADIKISCPNCPADISMENIYDNFYSKCTGRFPENEELIGNKLCFTKRKENPCEQQMSIIQKQSTSLRIARTRTLLKIPQFDEPVMDSFNNRDFKTYISTLAQLGDRLVVTKEEVIENGRRMLLPVDSKKLEEYLDNHEVKDLMGISKDLTKRPSHYCNAIDEEFESLRGNMKDSANFSKSDFKPYILKLPEYNFPLDVCAINKLTTVTAQLSYQRKPHSKVRGEDIEESDFVPVGYLDESTNKCWYPAFKGVGEGIFITSEEDPFKVIPGLEEVGKKWEMMEPNVDEQREEVITPLFGWWHTLSHALIQSLSLSCGYSSPSLHERVYVDLPSGKGGILIYNTSPGDDSGMGGLVDIVNNKEEFKKVLYNAINTIQVCSNDPLCSSKEIKKGGHNGAVCHNCLLISETSCEHHNRLLDRHFFIY